MALGSKKNKALSKAEIIDKAVELDLRRQDQIARQSKTISRLVTENQMMMGLLGEFRSEDPTHTGVSYQVRAGEILNNIQKLREEQHGEDMDNE